MSCFRVISTELVRIDHRANAGCQIGESVHRRPGDSAVRAAPAAPRPRRPPRHRSAGRSRRSPPHRDRPVAAPPRDRRAARRPPPAGRPPPGASQVPLVHRRGRQVEHDRDGRHPRGPRATKEVEARRALDAGGVDDREPSLREPPDERPVERRERRPRGGLVTRVAGDRRAKRVGREDLVGGEVARRERRLAGTRGPDEDDQRRLRELDDDGAGHREAGRLPGAGVRARRATRCPRTAAARASAGRSASASCWASASAWGWAWAWPSASASDRACCPSAGGRTSTTSTGCAAGRCRGRAGRRTAPRSAACRSAGTAWPPSCGSAGTSGIWIEPRAS